MKYLLDVNVLVAWGWSNHTEHERTVAWITSAKAVEATRFYTSVIPQLGFVRVSLQRGRGQLTIKEAAQTLAGMVASLRDQHIFLPDDVAAENFPEWCLGAARTTDAHLIQLAGAHGLKLATLDTQIPSAIIIPSLGLS